MKYAFIRSQSIHYKTSRLLRVLDVSASGYYDWLGRPESSRAAENRQIAARIKVFHKASHEIYGSPRIHKDLIDSGTRIGIKRVARLMKEYGVQSKMAKKFVVTTDSKNTMSPAPDRCSGSLMLATLIRLG